MWYEAPNCHHVRAENASTSEPAAFFATFVIEEVRVEGKGQNEECLIRSLTVLDIEERSPFNEVGERRKEKQGEEEEVGWMCGWEASRM